MKERNITIDFLKGIAILAVVFYHFGVGLPFGYLGVDIFFVVGGFLLINGLKHKLEEDKFNYWTYLYRKLIRLWPLVVILSIMSFGVGYFLMLPDDFENLVESVIASVIFSNNILQCITTKNYWDVVNFYKPLMHLWYIGILMQAYIVIPIFYMLATKIFKKAKNGIAIVTIGLIGISLVLYLLPVFPSAWKFYLLPFRLFEIVFGGIIVIWKPRANDNVKKAFSIISFSLLLILLCFPKAIISSEFRLLSVVLASAVFLWATEGLSYSGIIKHFINIGAGIGEKSYSIYIWHQALIAILFYSFFPKQNIKSFVVFLCITVILTLLSYYCIERPLAKVIEKKKKARFIVISTTIISILLGVASFWVYCHAGVVRNVPELGIVKNDTHRGMHAEYCDRPYGWDVDFSNDRRKKVLVLGNSFGRDWANILSEWDKNNSLEISYKYYTEGEIEKDYLKRINKADIVFFATGPSFDRVPSNIVDIVPQEKLYIVGNKNYGESNGIVYSHRFGDDYYNQTVVINGDLIYNIESDEEKFGNHYINMMKPVLVDDTHARVFTDDNKFISQDCRHLTQAGARYYARVLSLDWITD